MSNQITSREFWAEVSAIADSVLTEYVHGVIEDIDSAISELDRVEDVEELEKKVADVIEMIDDVDVDSLDDVYDRIHEMVDSHQWVIYYSPAWDVARLMSGDNNACEMFEELGCVRPGESLDNLICRFAYCALHSNAVAEIDDAIERWQTDKKAEIETIANNLMGKLCKQS